MFPPRRVGGGSVNAAALKAARQRNRSCRGESDDDDDDDPPPIFDHAKKNEEHHAQRRHIQEIVENDDSDGDNLRCLHCHTTSTEIQVRCDECSAIICDSCHWCHEFQANHEIRVCDRCDAFYCRGCDEMDQCDDCGEVVCASCSTLLSCKFCGGGLCEECATACGRYVVLCSDVGKTFHLIHFANIDPLLVRDLFIPSAVALCFVVATLNLRWTAILAACHTA